MVGAEECVLSEGVKAVLFPCVWLTFLQVTCPSRIYFLFYFSFWFLPFMLAFSFVSTKGSIIQELSLILYLSNRNSSIYWVLLLFKDDSFHVQVQGSMYSKSVLNICIVQHIPPFSTLNLPLDMLSPAVDGQGTLMRPSWEEMVQGQGLS